MSSELRFCAFLAKQPDDLVFAAHWQDRLSYEAANKCLVMTLPSGSQIDVREFRVIRDFSTDRAYKRAVDVLLKKACTQPRPLVLAHEPTDLAIPPHRVDWIEYDPNTKCLYLWAYMSFWVRRDLRKNCSKDPTFKAAIDQLAKESKRTKANNGLLFVSVFRWLLILLFALTLEKLAEGVCQLLTAQSQSGESFYHSFHLGIPFVSDKVAGYKLAGAHTAFLVVLFQIVITILLLVRYYTCLVEQIWRAKIDPLADFSNTAWQYALATVRLRTIVGTTLIAFAEFFLFYQAAISIANPMQWLHFLLLVVVVDTIYFLILPLLEALVLPVTFAALLVLAARFFPNTVAWSLTGGFLVSILYCVWRRRSDPQFTPAPTIAKYFDPPIRMFDHSWKTICSVFSDYVWWNAADLVLITFGIFLCAKNGLQLESVLTLAVFTGMISAANFYANRAVYLTHVSVLRLEPWS